MVVFANDVVVLNVLDAIVAVGYLMVAVGASMEVVSFAGFVSTKGADDSSMVPEIVFVAVTGVVARDFEVTNFVA